MKGSSRRSSRSRGKNDLAPTTATATTADQERKTRRDTNSEFISSPRRNSDSSTQRQYKHSNSVDSVSRFPYQARRSSSGVSRQRSRSVDSATSEQDDSSTEFTSTTTAATNNNSERESYRRPSSRPDSRFSFRAAVERDDSLDDSYHEEQLHHVDDIHRHTELDDSVASTALMLQESTTFPDLDQAAEHNAQGTNFAMEHRIFLKANLELLAERDKVATEVGMNDPNVLKSGPLKKASHLMRGIWKVKYVEIRRGMFSYYEDAVSSQNKLLSTSFSTDATTMPGGNMVGTTQPSAPAESLLRKNVPLEANACYCRAVRLHEKAWNITPRGAIFELSIAGKPKRLWMANSREERQAWIQAIHDAMVGGSKTRGGNGGGNVGSGQKSTSRSKSDVDARSPHREDLKKYLKTQSAVRNAKNKDEYAMALRSIYRHDLDVPVKWIIQQAEQEKRGNSNSSSDHNKGAFHEEDVKFSVDQLFKDLLRDTVKVNGQTFHGNSGHAPERITGELARKILLKGRAVQDDDDDDEDNVDGRTASKYDMSESQALAYARDVLLSGNRTRSGGDSYFCVNTLCRNEELVVIVPSSLQAEPVSITVSRDADGDPSLTGHDNMQSKDGWARTKKGKSKKSSWVKAYFVLSEGTLSIYEHALPRPHGLQGQMAIQEATISVSREEQKASANSGPKTDCFVLTIVTKDKSERQIMFEKEEKLLVWTYALECTAKAKGGAAPAPLLKALNRMIRRVPRVSVTGGSGIASPNNKAPMEDSSLKLEGTSLAEAALKEHVANLGLDFGVLEERLAAYANQSSAIVKVSIEAGTVYKICTLDPQGNEDEDTWAVVDATFLQVFRVSGGPNGRILRGEEIVRVDVSRCSLISKSVRRTASLPRGSPSSSTLRIQNLARTLSDKAVKR